MKSLFEHYCALPPLVRPALWRILHRALNTWDNDLHNAWLNYGYANLDEKQGSSSGPAHYGRQLYSQVIKGVDLNQKRVLEVGSGRGGGAAYLTRLQQPDLYIGLDISADLANQCNRHYQVQGLHFRQGKAEALPFETAYFDVVINIESARCYNSIPRFFSEVYRVLKPGGYFCFADMMLSENRQEVENALHQSKLSWVSQRDLLQNVTQALKLDSAARKESIDAHAPGWIRQALYEFAGIKGTNRFKAFETGKMQYQSYIMQKPATS